MRKIVSLALIFLGLGASAAFQYVSSIRRQLPGHAALFRTIHNSFQDYLDEDLIATLKTELSVVEPNQVQDQALCSFFEDCHHQNHRPKATIVCAQTGSGKTLTFLLPIIQTLRHNEKAAALVVAPTDLLVVQHQAILSKLDPTILDRVYFASMTSGAPLPTDLVDNSIVAIDEIDAVLYGSSRMDEETELTPMGQCLLHTLAHKHNTSILATTAFLSSAHLTALLERDLEGALLLREEGITSSQTQVLVPSLRQKFKYFSGDRLDKLVSVILDGRQDEWLSKGSTMIFCGTVTQAQQVFEKLKTSCAVETTMILVHEELDKRHTHNLMMQLRHDNADSTIVLVCTDVAARGLDIPNIRHVILHTVPTTVSAFIHQVGRTARKGQDGLLTCLVNTASGDAQKYTHLHALKAASELSF
jgi:superfamily II DNA/RNA helicase